MDIKLKLERKDHFTEDFRADQKIYEMIKNRLQRQRRSKYIEQNLGTDPIPIKDYLYNRLII